MTPTGLLDRAILRYGEPISLLFLVSVVITCYEVVLRYFFHAPTIWVHELTIALSAACFMIGGATCMAQNAHIRITVVYEKLPGRGRAACDLLSLIVGAAYVGGLLYGLAKQARDSIFRFRDGVWLPETTGRAWDVPIPPLLKALFVIACLLLLMQILQRIARALRRHA